MSTPPSAESEYRLVLYEVENGVVGSLYARRANPYSEPLFSFPLRPDQELPVLTPGGLVRARGEVASGCTPTIVAQDVEITPATSLTAGTPPGIESRLFAERGGVVCHPEISGWEPSWRYARHSSVTTVVDWERRLQREVRVAWLLAGFTVLMAALVVVVVVSARDPRPVVSLVALIASLATTVVTWRLARRSQRAVAQARARAEAPPRHMRMRLWWSAGHGQGPMAVASLFPLTAGSEAEAHVSVVNVPKGFAPHGLVQVDVVGLPSEAPIIRCGDVELWPAEFSHRVLGVKDEARGSKSF